MTIAIIVAGVVLLVGIVAGIHAQRVAEPRERAAVSALCKDFARWTREHDFAEPREVQVPTGEPPDGLTDRIDRVLAAHTAHRAGGDSLTVVAFVHDDGEVNHHRLLVSLTVPGLTATPSSRPSERGRRQWARRVAAARTLDEASTLALERAAVDLAGTVALHTGENRLDVLCHGPTSVVPPAPYTADLTGLLDSTLRLADVLGRV